MSDPVNVPVQVNLDPEQVNALISQAVLKSAIGKKLEEIINNKLKDYSLTRALEDAVGDAISQAIKHLLMKDEIRDKFNAAVRERVTDEAVSAIVMKLWDRLEFK